MIKYRLKIFLSELVVDKSRILPAYFFTIDFSKKKNFNYLVFIYTKIYPRTI